MSKVEVNTVAQQTGTTLTVGGSGKTVNSLCNDFRVKPLH
jgi:hypothetical protein